MVYIVKKGNEVIHHTSLEAMKEMDGIETPDLPLSDEEFKAAEGLVRIIDGEIFLGKTDIEKQSEQNAERIRLLKRYLAETDYIAAKIAEGSATTEEYAGQITQRQAWRAEIAELESA
ncbi:MAG: hypothetical protein LBO67_08920 [Spirochaetaceae bacterium]|jgi:hypothetical protein|nr:hypothetical protein [Spirochaetaceae bacterium]